MPPGALGIAEGPFIQEARMNAHLLSGCLERCSLNCTVIVFLELQNSFLDITLQGPEMEPCAKKLRNAIRASAAAIVPSGGSEIFYNQMSKTGFSHTTHMAPPHPSPPYTLPPLLSLPPSPWECRYLCSQFGAHIGG